MSVNSEHTEISVIRETLDVNFIGTFALTKALLPLLAKNGGRIANITVPSDISPYWHPLAYVASKAAQNAMMGVMAIENVVEIFSVHPGPTTTDLNGNMSLPGFHDIETVGQKTAELINDGHNHRALSDSEGGLRTTPVYSKSLSSLHHASDFAEHKARVEEADAQGNGLLLVRLVVDGHIVITLQHGGVPLALLSHRLE